MTFQTNAIGTSARTFADWWTPSGARYARSDMNPVQDRNGVFTLSGRLSQGQSRQNCHGRGLLLRFLLRDGAGDAEGRDFR
jgi:hypothetical protein